MRTLTFAIVWINIASAGLQTYVFLENESSFAGAACVVNALVAICLLASTRGDA